MNPAVRYALLVAAVLVAGGALWWALSSPGRQAPPPDPRDDHRRAALAEVPADLRQPVDAVTGAVRLVAERLPRDPERILEAVRDAVDAGHLRPRRLDGDAPGAPRTAGDLASALQGKAVGAAGGFELATLGAALLRARGHEDVIWGVDTTARFAATELLARRYLLRVGRGPWLALDRAPLEPASVRPLDDVERVANLLAWRALGAMPAGELATASRAAEHARRLAPDDAAIAFVLGKTQITAGHPEAGVATFERAAKLRSDAYTWYLLGRTARLQERPYRADQYFHQAIAADAGFVDPHLMLAELTLDRLEVTPRTERAGVLIAAREHLAAARAIDPDAEGIRLVDAHLAALEDDPERALVLLREESALYPTSEEAWLIQAQILAFDERDLEAVAVLREAVERGAATPEITRALGLLLAATGHWDDALSTLERALGLLPDDPELRPQIAQLQRARGDTAGARRLLTDQIRRFPGDDTSPLLLAQLEMDAGDLDRGLELVDDALARRPDDAEAVMLRYLGHILGERPLEAVRARAIEVAGARRLVAEVLLEQGQLGEALVILEDGLTAEPEDPIIAVLLVGLYHGMGRPEDGERLRGELLERFHEDDHAELNALFDTAIGHATGAFRGGTADPTP